MIVYIAGRMTGLPDKGRKTFNEAEEKLKARGYTVLNPAKLPDGMPKEKYMPICMAMIDAADRVYMLETWEDSKGAQIELKYALYQGKPIEFGYGYAKEYESEKTIREYLLKRAEVMTEKILKEAAETAGIASPSSQATNPSVRIRRVKGKRP